MVAQRRKIMFCSNTRCHITCHLAWWRAILQSMTSSLFILVLVQIVFNSFAQLLLKKGMMTAGPLQLALTPIAIKTFILKVFSTPLIWSGCFLYGFSTIICLVVLSRVPVSVAYPLGSLGYVFSALLAYFWLREKLSALQWLGILVIVLGVFLLVRN